MDSSTFEEIIQLIEIEMNQTENSNISDIENNEERFYAVARNLMAKKKRTWLEMQLKPLQKTIEKKEENMNMGEISLFNKKPINQREYFFQASKVIYFFN